MQFEGSKEALFFERERVEVTGGGVEPIYQKRVHYMAKKANRMRD